MILNEKQTTLAYRCPGCGGVTTSIVGAFSLSGSLFKLKCACGNSHMTVEKTSDAKMRLSVPCLVCNTVHTYVVSSNVFFDSDIFVIPCSLSGVDICFIGREKSVSDAIEASNRELLALLGEEELESLKNQERNRDELCDPQALEIVRYVINELNEENEIYCACEHGHGEYTCDVYDDYITVRCVKCGCKETIPTNSTMKAHELLECDKLILK